MTCERSIKKRFVMRSSAPRPWSHGQTQSGTNTRKDNHNDSLINPHQNVWVGQMYSDETNHKSVRIQPTLAAISTAGRCAFAANRALCPSTGMVYRRGL